MFLKGDLIKEIKKKISLEIKYETQHSKTSETP